MKHNVPVESSSTVTVVNGSPGKQQTCEVMLSECRIIMTGKMCLMQDLIVAFLFNLD